MSRVIVIEFVSPDGVMQDPDGSEGSRQGGWGLRYGPEAVAGDNTVEIHSIRHRRHA
jgi:hypothetical protein